jgi:hypothetical protein
MRASVTASKGQSVKIFTRVLLLLSTALVCLSMSTPAMAAVTLPSLFSDHMVVQRNMEVPVWGTDTANCAIHGVIWYQGESVTWGGNTYRDLQVGLVNSWRQAWGQDFTFLIVQLPNYNISSSGWSVLREARLQVLGARLTRRKQTS